MEAKKVVNKKLGDLLVENGIITAKQLEKALELQKDKGGLIGELLVELKFTTEEEIAKALTTQYGFAYMPLANYEIDQELTKLIPKRVARQYCLVPIDRISDSLTIAMSNPLNNLAIEDIETISGCKVRVLVSTSTDIKEAINKYYT